MTCLKDEVISTADLSIGSTTASMTTTMPPAASESVPPTTKTTVALYSSKSVARDDRNSCVSPPTISNGHWVCNSNVYTNGVVCFNQCSNGFSFDRKDFFRQEISCKCIIDGNGHNECRWTQRSRVIKEAAEFSAEFWRNFKLPECLPNANSQKSTYKIQFEIPFLNAR